MDGKKVYEKLKKKVQSFSPFVKSWNSAKSLFAPKLDDALKEALILANLKLALKIFVFAALIATFISVLTLLESMYLTNFTTDTLAQVTGTIIPKITIAEFWPVAMLQIIINLPLALAVSFFCECVAYSIAKATGGTGTFARQFHLAAIISLSLTMVGLLVLLMPVPCIQILAWVAMIIGMIYLWVYVTGKSYSLVHGISFPHALVIAIVIVIIRSIVTILMMNFIAGLMNLPPIVNFGGG